MITEIKESKYEQMIYNANINVYLMVEMLFQWKVE